MSKLKFSCLFVPVGSPNHKQENEGLQKSPTYHTNPNSLQPQCPFKKKKKGGENLNMWHKALFGPFWAFGIKT